MRCTVCATLGGREADHHEVARQTHHIGQAFRSCSFVFLLDAFARCMVCATLRGREADIDEVACKAFFVCQPCRTLSSLDTMARYMVLYVLQQHYCPGLEVDNDEVACKGYYPRCRACRSKRLMHLLCSKYSCMYRTYVFQVSLEVENQPHIVRSSVQLTLYAEHAVH